MFVHLLTVISIYVKKRKFPNMILSIIGLSLVRNRPAFTYIFLSPVEEREIKW